MRLGAARGSSVAPSLAVPFPALEKAGLRLLRGQTSLTVAAPGVGKSQLWQNLANRMKVPTLYWSADTDQNDVTARSIALWSGFTTAEVEHGLTDPDSRAYLFGKLAGNVDHIDWVFDSPITGQLAGDRLNAFAEVHGEYPHLFVLDNLSNAIQSVADEYAQTKELLAQLQTLARETKAHIAVLHHAKGQYDNGTTPIPQSGGIQNPFKIPEVGLTLHRPDGAADRLAVNLVKNRGGRSDPAAQHPTYLPVDFARAFVGGFK